MARPHHVPALDGLRGLAVLAVMAYHGSAWATGGFLGVDVFFALSGYLITSVLLRERAVTGRISLRRFYARRALRLMPALGLLLGLYVVTAAGWDAEHLDVHLGDAALALTYTANVPRALQVARPVYLAPTWSLAVEGHFYLLWAPLLAWLLGRVRSTGSLARSVLVLAAVGWGVKSAALLAGAHPSRLYYMLDGRADALLVGCALALFCAASQGWQPAGTRERRMLSWAGMGVLACWVLLLPTAGFDDRESYLWRSTFVAATTALLIFGVLRVPEGPIARVLAAAPLAAVGRVSYGLYLWHYPIFLTLTRDLRLSLAYTLVLGGLLSLAAAVASYQLVELPALRRKDALS